MRLILTACGLAALTLAGCATDQGPTGQGPTGQGPTGQGPTGMPIARAATATALLHTATGADAGRATATDVAGGVRYTLDVTGLSAGTHGAHVHMTGRCDAPGFATAGGHWNPTGAKHGTLSPMGPHEGDLPNLIVGTDGRGTLGVTIPGATIAALLDADGAAIVVHAGPDDLKTDPAGNSGSRIACGVFAAS